MKHFVTIFNIISILFVFNSYAQIPNIISYQGILTDDSGTLVSGDRILTFMLYDAETNGTQLWQEVQVVPVMDGSFHVNLGEVTPFNLSFSDSYWLSIKVGSGTELSPRIQLTSNAYSFMAKTVSDTSISTSKLVDGAVTQSKLAPGLSLPPGGAAGGDLSGNYPDPQIANQAVTGAKIATGQVVKSLNSMHDNIVIAAEGGATINTSGDTLIINAGVGGGGIGVQGIQNNDNTLQITNPTGPTVTVNMQAGGVTGIQIADSTITINKLDPSISLPPNGAAGGDLAGTYPNPSVVGLQGNMVSANPPTTGQVLKWNGSAWTPNIDNAGTSFWNQSGSNIYYNDGDVGLGIINPSSKFEIYHNSSLSDPHILLHENGNDYARLNFDNNNGSNYWTIAAYIASNHRNDRLNFWNGTGGDVMTITGDGEVGIGVGISPKVPFHVGNGRRVLFGTDTLGNGDKLMFLPDLHAFRVGAVATGAASTYWNRDSIGLYSFASGLNTRAQGYGATAMGRDTEAQNSYAFASGFFSNANGQYSTAMGFNTDALGLGSTALGYSTDAEENYSFAAGYFAEAQAIYSVAVGNAVQAQSYASMAVGRYNVGGGSATSWLTSDPIFEIGIGTGPSTRANAVTVRKNGNVGIGTTVPLDALHVNGRVRFQTVEYFEDGGTNEIAARGDIRPTSDNTYDLGTSSMRWDDVYATNGTIVTSDYRDKEQIEKIPYGLDEVMRLKPVRFKWKNNPDNGFKLGLIAQDLQPVIKEVVKSYDYKFAKEEDTTKSRVELDRLGVYYSDLIPVLIKAIQEQQEQIEILKSQVDELSRR
jgi:hypothetical protein